MKSAWIWLVLVVGLSSIPALELKAQSPEKLHAFVKTYGYVRFFHPSDQASLIDWNQMAVFGAREVIDSPKAESVETLITRLFSPVVVDLDVYAGKEKQRPPAKEVSASQMIAWQHFGVGLGVENSLYHSHRLNREGDDFRIEESDHASVLQATDANGLRGKEVRLQFKAKVDRAPCDLQAWFEVAGESGQGMSEDMAENPVTGKEWASYEVLGKIDKDAELLTFGFRMSGKGTCLIDDVRLEFKDDDEWFEIEIENANFEDGEDEPEGWISEYDKFACLIESDDVAEGGQAMRIAAVRRVRSDGEESMYELPELGEVVDAEICEGIRIRLPLTLPEEHRYVSGDDEQTDSFVASVESFELPEDAKLLAVANVAIAWNIFQHFYPYFDQVSTDWDSVLDESLKRAIVARDRQDVTDSLGWLVAELHDGHGNFVDFAQMRNMQFLPVTFDWIEDRVVVIASDDERFKPGDIVTRYGGSPVDEVVAEKEKYISGSPQWKRFRAMAALSMVHGEKSIEIEIDGGSEKQEFTVASRVESSPSPEKRQVIDAIVEETPDGGGAIYYVDLGRAEPGDVDPMIEKFANAKGIVFDVRGYPRGTEYLFQHMTDRHMQSAKWLVSAQMRPDRADIYPFSKRGRWEMPPREPRFKGKMIFLTNGSAISYAESCMAIVAHYELAEIIGSPTAGANGNVNYFELPGGFRAVFTGMRVMNHDDSQHHILGVQPTIPMKPTIKGIREGKDELLDRAIEIIKSP